MNLALPIHDRYKESLLEAHWAAQVPASASQLIAAVPDWSHTNLLVEGGVLRGRSLTDGRRVEIDLPTLTLRVGDVECRLEGRTLQEGLAWLSQQLGATVELLNHELPPRAPDQPFALCGAEVQLQWWFNLAQQLLSEAAGREGGGEVRVWPHHFDIATLIELDEGGGEAARSINVGLSPGDGSHSEPYWYVTPWPLPGGALPSLAIGKWHTEGFTAAVFPASEHDPAQIETQAARFLKESIVICRELIE